MDELGQYVVDFVATQKDSSNIEELVEKWFNKLSYDKKQEIVNICQFSNDEVDKLVIKVYDIVKEQI